MQDQRIYNRTLIEEFRASQGASVQGRPLLLLTTVGARSGQMYTAPLMYISEADRLLIIASNIGAPMHPDWYRNLVAHPQVTVEIGSETFNGTAETLQGEERTRVWAEIVQRYPFFAEHQAQTTRQIPVVALYRPGQQLDVTA